MSNEDDNANAESIFKWDVDDISAGTIDFSTGDEFIDEGDVLAIPYYVAEGETDIRLTGGIAFAPGGSINIETATNTLDADSAPGPTIPVGDVATITYTVTNSGSVALSSIVVTDNNGTAGTGDDFNPTFVGGDANANTILDLDETWTYTSSVTVTAGQYTNIGSAATSLSTVSDSDASNHFGGETPIIPLASTGDLIVLDDGGEALLRLTPDGCISVIIDQEDIIAVTGDTDVDFEQKGIAVDDDGTIYFVDDETDSVMRYTTGGVLTILATQSALTAVKLIGSRNASDLSADPDGIALGDDGFLYISDDGEDVGATNSNPDDILKINLATGVPSMHTCSEAILAVSSLAETDVERGIVALSGGELIISNQSDIGGGLKNNEIIKIDTNGVPSVLVSDSDLDAVGVLDLDVFMTRAPNGDIIVADEVAEKLFRVTLSGTVSVFLEEADLAGTALAGRDFQLFGGIAFDSAGNFFLGNEDDAGDSESIIKWNVLSLAAGTIDFSSVSEFARESDIESLAYGAATDVDFEGGIAFAPASTAVPVALC